MPFQGVLEDIKREKDLLESEVREYKSKLRLLESSQKKASVANGGSGGGGLNDGICLSPVRLLQSRLRHQEERCVQLQEAMMEQQRLSQKILQGTDTVRDINGHDLECWFPFRYS